MKIDGFFRKYIKKIILFNRIEYEINALDHIHL